MDQDLKDFTTNLRCPNTGSALRILEAEEVTKLNASVLSGSLKNKEGVAVSGLVADGFINAGESYIYPVLDGYIAVLLPDRAISLKNEVSISDPLSVAEKKCVQGFYDEFGWKKSEDSSYNDTVTFEDRRPVSQRYWSRCHLRLNKYFKGGDFLLDVASGAIPNEEYLTYSQKYRLRICMDFSLLAVKEAATRLGGKGIFILGDMTNIPLADNCIDSVISMHTVYHIPLAEQTKAVAEAYRVLKPGKQAVIVYSWKRSPLMRLAFNAWAPVLRTYKRIRKKPDKIKEVQTDTRPELFVQQQNYDWFARQIKNQFKAHLVVYSSISRSFSHTFLKEKMFGSKLSSIIYWIENRIPSAMGKWGQYPVFLLTKGSESAGVEKRGLSRGTESSETKAEIIKHI